MAIPKSSLLNYRVLCVPQAISRLGVSLCGARTVRSGPHLHTPVRDPLYMEMYVCGILPEGREEIR